VIKGEYKIASSVKSIFFENFSFEEVKELYLQHTHATEQKFTEDAFSQKEIEESAKRMIVARQTHLDSLVSKLNEPRVKKILLPLIQGSFIDFDENYDDDVLYLRDLGIIKRTDPVTISNPIYKEVILRVLSNGFSGNITFSKPSFVKENGRLHWEMVLEEFAVWWKRNAEHMQRKGNYPEAASQLVFMAWLQRVVNGKGFVDREYGIGRGRIDIYLRWPIKDDYKKMQEEAVEIKVWRDSDRESPFEEGLEQLEEYLDRLSLTRGTLLIFDERTSALSLRERTRFEEHRTVLKNHQVTLLWL